MFYTDYLKFKNHQTTRVEKFNNQTKHNQTIYKDYTKFIESKYEQIKYLDTAPTKCHDLTTNIACQTGNNIVSIPLDFFCTLYGVQSLNIYFNSYVEHHEILIREFLNNYYTNNYTNFYNVSLNTYTTEQAGETYTVSIIITFYHNNSLTLDIASQSEAVVSSLNTLLTKIDADFFQVVQNDIRLTI
jgi:hypothetical protein